MEKKGIQRITAILLVIGLILTGCGGSGAASADAEQGRTEAEAQDSQAVETEESQTSDTEDNRAMAPANQTQKAENALIRMEAEDLPRAAREYTVLIYMVGSNLETNRGAATSDLEEMLSIRAGLANGLPTSHVTATACWTCQRGAAAGWRA